MTSLDSDLLWIRVESGLHVGTGHDGGGVDLTLAREAHSGWPYIPSSSVKGVLRATYPEGTRREIFGSSEASAVLAFGAARLAAMTVRSLKGTYVWIACPTLVHRLARERAIGGWPNIQAFDEVQDEDALCSSRSPALIDGEHLILEEYAFARRGAADAVLALMRGAISDAIDEEKSVLEARLVVISDRAFGHFVRHAPPARTKVALNYEQKTASEGALFSEEVLSADTIFCAPVWTPHGRARERDKPRGRSARQWVRGLGRTIVQFGGGLTTGVGQCELTLETRHQEQM